MLCYVKRNCNVIDCTVQFYYAVYQTLPFFVAVSLVYEIN